MRIKGSLFAFVGFFASLLGSFLGSTAQADENQFGYVYGSETLPQGGSEFYSWTTLRSDRGKGRYKAWDQQFEFEHGITDRFQVSLYLTANAHEIEGSASLDAQGMPKYSDRHSGLSFNGTKVAFKYNILSAYKDPVGLSVYLEPGTGRMSKGSGAGERSYFLEGKIILSKHFLDSQLIAAYNLTLEAERAREDGGDEWEKELEIDHSAGISLRVAPNWFVGTETRYTSEYPEFEGREHWALFVGPNVHYANARWWFTATWLAQVVGEPREAGRSDQLYLGSNERNEYRLVVGYNF